MTHRSWTLPRVLLVLSGWIALLATELAAGHPLRVALTSVFLLSCPGAAVLRLARPVPTWWPRGPERLVAGSLAVALSGALTALTAMALFLGHAFTIGRAVLALAALTTVLALLPTRARPAPGLPLGSGPRRAGWRAFLGIALLLASAACGAGGGSHSGSGSQRQQSQAMGSGGLAGGSDPSAQPAAPGPWHSVFLDDFNGTSLNQKNWATCYDWNNDGCTNAGNHEYEWYLPSQVSVNDGALALTAERQATQGSDGRNYPWASGMVTTGRDSWDAAPRHTFTYGYYAAAIQAPAQGTGMFPAFWLLPAATRGGLPELDIAEFINSNQYVDMNLHGKTPDGVDKNAHHRYGPQDFAGGYHVFAMDWEPNAVTWYVDGVQQFQVTDRSAIPTTAMELVIDLAVGFEQPPPAPVTSTQLHVDWVEVWQH